MDTTSSTSGPAGNVCLGYPQKTDCVATFSDPEGVAVDRQANIYVADSFNNTIRLISPSGLVTTLAGLAGAIGSADGTANAARFRHPQAVAVDSAGNIYVADRGNNTIRKVTPAGVVITLAGLARSAGHADGKGGAARFFYPQGVAVDKSGNVYVADTGNDEIRVVTPDGRVTTLVGLSGNGGTADGKGSAAQFYNPRGLAVDFTGNIYVADRGNSTIRKVTPDGVVTTLAGLAGRSGLQDGAGSAALFSLVSGVAVDGAGNVYAADTDNNTIRKVTLKGVVTTLAGLPGHTAKADGTGSAVRFMSPQGIAADQAGNIYVADALHDTICQITPAGVVTTLAGWDGHAGSADGMANGGGTPPAVPGANTISVATSRDQIIISQ